MLILTAFVPVDLKALNLIFLFPPIGNDEKAVCVSSFDEPVSPGLHFQLVSSLEKHFLQFHFESSAMSFFLHLKQIRSLPFINYQFTLEDLPFLRN